MSQSTSAQPRWKLQPRATASGRYAQGSPASPIALRYKAQLAAEYSTRRSAEWATRALNVAVALIGIVVTAPLLLVIALVVKLSSPGPVIYKQRRIGVDRRRFRGADMPNQRRSADHGGKLFTIYKFRTMRSDPAPAKEQWATTNDPRVTSVGRFLRATRLDEIPQFFNVLKGDMNIVGPRPEQPGIFAELRSEFADYRRRQRVLPGITGLAQIELGYDTDLSGVRKKVDLDLEYIRQRSAMTDLRIMAKTVPVMVFRKVWM